MMCGHRPWGFNQWLVNSSCALDTAMLGLSANWLLRVDIVSEFRKSAEQEKEQNLNAVFPYICLKVSIK